MAKKELKKLFVISANNKTLASIYKILGAIWVQPFYSVVCY